MILELTIAFLHLLIATQQAPLTHYSDIHYKSCLEYLWLSWTVQERFISVYYRSVDGVCEIWSNIIWKWCSDSNVISFYTLIVEMFEYIKVSQENHQSLWDHLKQVSIPLSEQGFSFQMNLFLIFFTSRFYYCWINVFIFTQITHCSISL